MVGQGQNEAGLSQTRQELRDSLSLGVKAGHAPWLTLLIEAYREVGAFELRCVLSSQSDWTRRALNCLKVRG
jgi:hypothetical protein